jgi:hypothetical protein
MPERNVTINQFTKETILKERVILVEAYERIISATGYPPPPVFRKRVEGVMNAGQDLAEILHG